MPRYLIVHRWGVIAVSLMKKLSGEKGEYNRGKAGWWDVLAKTEPAVSNALVDATIAYHAGEKEVAHFEGPTPFYRALKKCGAFGKAKPTMEQFRRFLGLMESEHEQEIAKRARAANRK